MQSNATVSMFSQLWMARARALCILCPAVNIWLTLIRKWPPGPGHLYSYPEYFSSLRDLYIRPFSLHALIQKRRFNKNVGDLYLIPCGGNGVMIKLQRRKEMRMQQLCVFSPLFPDVVTHLCLSFQTRKRRFFQINAVQGTNCATLRIFVAICPELQSLYFSFSTEQEQCLLCK